MIGIFGNWGPAQGNEYSCALTWGNIFRLHHKTITAICGGIALVLTAMNFFAYFGSFIIFLSNCVPAIIGVFMADFLYTYRKGYPLADRIRFPFDWRGLLAVLGGIALAYASLPGIPQIWCVCGAVILRVILNSVGSDSPAKVYQQKL